MNIRDYWDVIPTETRRSTCIARFYFARVIRDLSTIYHSVAYFILSWAGPKDIVHTFLVLFSVPLALNLIFCLLLHPFPKRRVVAWIGAGLSLSSLATTIPLPNLLASDMYSPHIKIASAVAFSLFYVELVLFRIACVFLQAEMRAIRNEYVEPQVCERELPSRISHDAKHLILIKILCLVFTLLWLLMWGSGSSAMQPPVSAIGLSISWQIYELSKFLQSSSKTVSILHISIAALNFLLSLIAFGLYWSDWGIYDKTMAPISWTLSFFVVSILYGIETVVGVILCYRVLKRIPRSSQVYDSMNSIDIDTKN